MVKEGRSTIKSYKGNGYTTEGRPWIPKTVRHPEVWITLVDLLKVDPVSGEEEIVWKQTSSAVPWRDPSIHSWREFEEYHYIYKGMKDLIMSVGEEDLNNMKVNKEQALRYNEGKPELSYVLDVMPALKDMVAVLEFGANKYARNNWKKGFPKEKLLDSMLRHIDAFYSGEDIDPESGLPHVGHILCNAAFLGYHFGSNSEYWKERQNEK